MTASEQRAAVVTLAKSREKKNQYTQGDKRDLVGSGWSDCSSFVRWCYLKLLSVDIGGNTAAQIVNKKLANVADVNQYGGKVPPESAMLPGDLIYFKGTDVSRPRGCGHVEMYIGAGKIIGHGSGTGPTIKDMSSYCTSRANSGKGWLCVLRVIADTIPADPAKEPPKPVKGVRITGGSVNLRYGPGTEYTVAGEAKKGDMFEHLASITSTNDWLPILHEQRVLWVSPNMAEVVK